MTCIDRVVKLQFPTTWCCKASFHNCVTNVTVISFVCTIVIEFQLIISFTNAKWRLSKLSLLFFEQNEISNIRFRKLDKLTKSWFRHWPQSFFDVQSDQVGRIFAYWVIVCLGQFFENYRGSPKIFKGKIFVFILTKSGRGYILDDFLSNSSGHPGCR
jgi:hypothetical protein